MIYFHVTTQASADSILRDGFDDRSSEVIDGRLWKGIWLCDELIWQMQPDDPVAIESNWDPMRCQNANARRIKVIAGGWYQHTL
jgi:hypothetical protein